MLSTGDRVRVILDITDFLRQQYEWDRIRFIMESFGLSLSSDDPLEQDLASGRDDQIIDLAQFLRLDVPVGAAQSAEQAPATSARPLFVFGSHLSEHKAFVGEVGRELEVFGIDLFVAHDTITHDTAWEEEIRQALDRSDAGLVFVHRGLRDSRWCDQEIGWLQGRHVPVMALRFDETPYGFFAKYQAQPVAPTATAADIAAMTVERIAAKPELAAGLAASLVLGLQNSSRFRTTDLLWNRLRGLALPDEATCLQLLEATKKNDQIYGATSPWDEDERQPYPRAVIAYLWRQPRAEAIAVEVDAYEQSLNEQQEALQREARRSREAASGGAV